MKGTYNLDDSATRSLGPTHHASFKSTSKRETFSVHSGEVCFSKIESIPTTEKNQRLFSCRAQLIIDLSRRLSKNLTDNCFRTFLFLINIFQLIEFYYFRRRHCLTISAPAIPPPASAPQPGPGAYDIRDFKETEKKYMSSAAFVSSTSRWVIDTTVAGEQPGPASYTPRAPMKQSFNFNFERKWL